MIAWLGFALIVSQWVYGAHLVYSSPVDRLVKQQALGRELSLLTMALFTEVDLTEEVKRQYLFEINSRKRDIQILCRHDSDSTTLHNLVADNCERQNSFVRRLKAYLLADSDVAGELTKLAKVESKISSEERANYEKLYQEFTSYLGLMKWIEVFVFVTLIAAFILISACVFQPMTAQISRIFTRLYETKSKLEAAVEARSVFVANVTHELRTPLNGILGMVGLLMKTELGSRQKHYAKIVQDSASTLLALVNDILDFSEIQAGRMSLKNKPFDLIASVEQVVARAYMRRTDAPNLELIVDLDPILDGQVFGDSLRIKQSLTNLLGNAQKFTETGFIIVRVFRERSDEVIFEVEDTGPGIPENAVGRIFDAFERINSPARKAGGTGLGLSITRKIALLMGGNAGYKARPGGGSIFWFSARLPKVAESNENRSRSLPLVVLLFDYSPMQASALEQWFRYWDTEYFRARGHEQAKAVANIVSEQGKYIDLVLCEYPKTSINDLIALSDQPGLSKTRFILMAEAGLEMETMDLTSERFTQVLKPLPTDKLKSLLQSQLEVNNIKEDSENINLPLRVLLVDDNPVNIEVSLMTLEAFGCQVSLARNGAEAVATFDPELFDVVFMDCQMPVMNGFEAARHIRQKPGGNQVPIFALTAGGTPEERIECTNAGMSDVLMKPIDSDALLACLRSVAR